MSALTEYSPLAPGLSLVLTNNHLSSIPANSPLTYILNDLDDFLPIAKTGDDKIIYAMDFGTANSIFWCLDRLVRYLKRCAGIEPGFPNSPNIPEHMYHNLGLIKPRLVEYAEQYQINPLLNQGSKEVLTSIFKALQGLGRELVDWMMEARWLSFEMEGGSLWNFNQPGINAFVSDARVLMPAVAEPPVLMDVDPVTTIEGEADRMAEDSEEGGLQMVLHPTESRFVQRYPGFDVFKGQTLIDNGYVEE
jgi:hypothetical protein